MAQRAEIPVTWDPGLNRYTGGHGASQGQIKRIDNLSGHYRPTVSEAMNYPELLQDMGFDLNNTWVELYDIEIDSSGLVESVTKSYTKMLRGE